MRRHGRPFVSAALPAVFPPLLLVLLLTTSALALPVQNDSSVENSRLIADLLAGGSTAEPQRTSGRWDSPLESNQTFVSGPIHRLSEEQWERLTSPPDGRPLITDVAFKLTGRPSPRYAFVTASSYNQYLEYLGTLCRKAEDGDIAEVRLNSLDNDYFAWEELQFNRAIIKRIFPEHEQGDHRRYLEASRTLRKMHLRADPASQCVPPKTEDTWSARVAERNQFEDFIINTVLDVSKMEELQKRRHRKTGKKFARKAVNETGGPPALPPADEERLGGENRTSTANSTDLSPAEWPS